MYKKIILMFTACLLAACSTVGVKTIPAGARGHQRVDYFAGGRQQVAFKVVAQLSDGYLQGVLRVKRLARTIMMCFCWGRARINIWKP